MDIEHFQIIVAAMLTWADEPKVPKKTSGRGTAGPGDELDDDDDEALVDESDDDIDDLSESAWRTAAPKAVVKRTNGADALASEAADQADA